MGQSRIENILENMLGATHELPEPQSRNEALLTAIYEQGGTGGIPVASTSTLGGVKIDGETITIDENGVISMAVSSGDSVEY